MSDPYFTVAETGARLGERAFAEAAAALRGPLLQAQQRLHEAAAGPLLVIVSGVETAGKSEVVNRLNEWLDARGVQTVAFWDESDEERERPRHWRFWRQLPPRGAVGVFFGSWYTQPIVARALRQSRRAAFEAELAQIVALERMLADDGAVLVKLWFHLSKRAQDARLAAIARERDRRLTPWERSFSAHYDRFAKVSAAALAATDAPHAPWHLIDAEDPRQRDVAAARCVLAGLAQAVPAVPVVPVAPVVAARPAARPAPPTDAESDVCAAAATTVDPVAGASPTLAAVDLAQRLGPRGYARRLAAAQTRLDALAWKMRRAGRSTVLVFEGWDAAGKGSTIRRLTAAIDARLVRVVPVAAPTDEERAHHYLWRFWRHLPRAGYVTVFDRSWYGRVLVERVEGFAGADAWQRAYGEIDHFERQLAGHGSVVHKFWLHLSPAEQRRRFDERSTVPHKQHKIGPEDWRNRSRWNEYELALEEMFVRCAPPHAPWTVVPAEDKRFARVMVLETLAARLEAALAG